MRPLTAKWHPMSIAGTLSAATNRTQFRTELAALQTELKKYTRMLADMAGVEDLTTLEED